MKASIKLIATVFVFAFLAIGFVGAQRYSVKNLNTEKSKSRGYDFLGVDNQGFVYLASFRSFNFVLVNITKPWMKVVSSETGGLVAEANLDNNELKAMGYKYITTTFLKDKPIIVVRKRADISGAEYYGIELDRQLNFIGQPFKLGEKPLCRGFNAGTQKGFHQAVSYYKAPERNVTFLSEMVCQRDARPSFFAITLNENHNEIAALRFELPIENAIVEKELVRIADNLLISVKSVERIKIDGRTFQQLVLVNRVFLVDPLGNVLPLPIDLGPNKIPGEVTLVRSNDKVLVSGQIVQANSDKLLGLFSASFDIDNKTINLMEQTLFSEAFITKFWDDKSISRMRQRGGSADMTSNYKLIEKFDMSDGGAAYVIQKKYVQQVIRNINTASGVSSPVVDYYYYYLDVMVAKINDDGKLAWIEKVPLEQVTQNYDPGRGFVATHQNGAVYLLHASSDLRREMINKGAHVNERKSRKDKIQHSVAVTKIDQFGNVRSDDVLDLRKERISFSPTSVAVDHENKRFTIIASPRQLFVNGKKLHIYAIQL